MKGIEIKQKIDTNNSLIEKAMSPNLWTLNNTIKELLIENEELQKICPHEYEDGYCIYCYKGENI